MCSTWTVAWPEDGAVIAVLKTPPVAGPLDAVRASIVARFKGKQAR